MNRFYLVSGSMEMNEGSSISSISQSRGVSVENEIRGSSQSSDEGVPPLGTDRSHHSMSPRNDRLAFIYHIYAMWLNLMLNVFPC